MKTLNYRILCSLLFVLASCVDNSIMDVTELKEINEVQIDGIESSYSILAGEKLKIQPVLTFTKDDEANAGNYGYEWVYNLGDVSGGLGTLATTRDLDLEIQLSPRDYTMLYRVTDPNTGVKSTHTFTLSVRSIVYEGWVVLSDVNGTARLDMASIIDEEFEVIPDVLARVGSDLVLEGAPVNVACYYEESGRYFGDNLFPGREPKFYVSAEGTGTTGIHFEDLSWNSIMRLPYEVLGRSVPTNYLVDWIQPKGWWSHGLSYTYLYEGGDLYVKAKFGNSSRGYNFYGYPINIVQGENTAFTAAPFIAGGPSYSGNTLVFDADNRRFVRQSSPGDANCVLMPEGDLFDYNDVGMDLVYMTSTPFNSEHMAILKNPDDNSVHLARIQWTLVQEFWGEMTAATNIAQAEHIAITAESGKPYIFYSVGSTVYQYNFGDNTMKMALDLPGQEITWLGFDYYQRSMGFSDLIVASHDPNAPAESSGTLSLYEVPHQMQNLVLNKSFNGFGKIKDVTYKHPPTYARGDFPG